jgi:ribosomal protein S18 acetylase RimI-like enzyme
MMKKLLLILLFASASLWSNPNHMKLVPFNAELHADAADWIHCQNFRGNARDIFSSDTFSDMLEDLDSSYTIKICILNNSVIGLIVYRDEKIGTSSYRRHIHYIAIHKKLHGKGYGTACMQQCEQEHHDKNIAELMLESMPSDRAIRFYERLGFTRLSPNSLVMSKKITQSDSEPINVPSRLSLFCKKIKLVSNPFSLRFGKPINQRQKPNSLDGKCK